MIASTAIENFDLPSLRISEETVRRALNRAMVEPLTYEEEQVRDLRDAGWTWDEIHRTLYDTDAGADPVYIEVMEVNIALKSFAYYRHLNEQYPPRLTPERGWTPAATCGGRHRRTSGARPVRSRGSRRGGSGSDDDDGESDRPPGPTLGRRGHENLTLAWGRS